MKRLLMLFALIFAANVTSHSFTIHDSLPRITYHVDLTNYKDDVFHVTVLTENLSLKNNIYNFAATAP